MLCMKNCIYKANSRLAIRTTDNGRAKDWNLVI